MRDLQSRNGIKVNNVRVPEKRLDPGDILSVAKHRYEIQYSPMDLGAVGPPPLEDATQDIFSKSLLESSGLVKNVQHIQDPSARRRFEVTNSDAGQINVAKNLRSTD